MWRHASAVALLLVLATTIVTPLIARSTREGRYLVTKAPPPLRVLAFFKSVEGANITAHAALEQASTLDDGWTPILAMFVVACTTAAQTSTSSWLAGRTVTKTA